MHSVPLPNMLRNILENDHARRFVFATVRESFVTQTTIRTQRTMGARSVGWFAVFVAISIPSLAQQAAQLQDYTEVDAKELGIEFVAPTKDPATGFVVGGKNATEQIRRLTQLNGQPIADLERDMRPEAASEVSSTAGFLGPDESLIEVLASDNRYVVDQLGLTHQQLAQHLRVLAAIAEKTDGQEFLYRGSRFRATAQYSRGYQLSPFRDGTKTNVDITLENLTNGEKLEYSLLVPLMIERYGFYEGRGTAYRVEPARIVAILGLAP